MNNEEIREILALLQGTNITVFELERDGVRIKIQKSPLLVGEGIRLPPAGMAPQEGMARIYTTPSPAERTPAANTRVITAPIVGTFFRAPSPDTSPYVDVGAPVQKGQILCIIEAMKLMNEIESEFDGTVRAILLENGQAVEFGTPLIEIELSPEA
jgi:acetyl-CoA carboxylase biotin carboxyl carrier protein